LNQFEKELFSSQIDSVLKSKNSIIRKYRHYLPGMELGEVKIFFTASVKRGINGDIFINNINNFVIGSSHIIYHCNLHDDKRK
jgi:hypothetical protein